MPDPAATPKPLSGRVSVLDRCVLHIVPVTESAPAFNSLLSLWNDESLTAHLAAASRRLREARAVRPSVAEAAPETVRVSAAQGVSFVFGPSYLPFWLDATVLLDPASLLP